jgi:CHAT domain-containing protein
MIRLIIFFLFLIFAGLRSAFAQQPDSAGHWLGLAKLKWSQQNATDGLVFAGKASQAFDARRIPDSAALAYKLTGDIQYKLKAYEASESAYRAAISRKGKDLPFQAGIYEQLGAIYRRTGRYDRSLEAFELARKHYETLRDTLSLASVNFLKGGIYFRKFDYEAGLSHYRQALSLNGNKQNSFAAQNYFQMAGIHEKRGESGIAAGYFADALKIWRRDSVRNRNAIAKAYNNLASMYLRMNDFPKAEQNLLACFGIYEATGDTLGMGDVLFDLGELNMRLGKKQKAESFYKQGRALWMDSPGINRLQKARAQRVFAGYAHSAGDQSAALVAIQDGFRQLIPGFRPKSPWENPGLDSGGAFRTDVLRLLALKGMALESWRTSGIPEADRLRHAFNTYRDAVSTIDSLRIGFEADDSKLELFQDSWQVYEGAIRVAFRLAALSHDLSYREAAFTFAEKSKAILLLEAGKDQYARFAGGIPASMLAEEDSLVGALSESKRELQRALIRGTEQEIEDARNGLFLRERSCREFVLQLERNYPQYYHLKYDIQPVTVEALQDYLKKERSTLVAFFYGRRDIFLFVVHAGSLQMARIENPENIRQRVQGYYRMLQDRQTSGDEATREIAWSLYRDLLGDFVRTEKKPARLIIVPDGVLGYVPFESLLTKEPIEGQPHSSLPYLLRSFSVSYANSATLLLQQVNWKPPKGKNSQPFLGVAPLFLSGSPFNPLPLSEAEVSGLKDMLGGDVLSGMAATRKAFLKAAPDYRILHISSHASAVDTAPMNSWIAFAPDPAEADSGMRLYLREIYDMKLQADMVVLGACETGSGKIYLGEGILGLSHGFNYAGSKSLFTTLWSVNDAATSGMMTAFYQYLEKGLSKPEALRMARIDYLEETDALGATPYYWAAARLVGDPGPISFPSRFPYGIGLVILGIAIVGFYLYYKRKARTRSNNLSL